VIRVVEEVEEAASRHRDLYTKADEPRDISATRMIVMLRPIFGVRVELVVMGLVQ
jgi:hypothetical protein